MKKIIFKWSLLLIFPLLITGCSDFLEEEPLASSSKENYYRTPYQLQEALNGVYDLLQSNLYNNCEWIFGEACGDDVLGNDEYSANQIAELVNFRYNTSNTWILNRYTVNYRGINRANQVIANVNKVKLASNDYGNYTTVREILGQAKFLRAMFYFNLVKTYGGVPIRPETESINNLVIPRSTKEEVYAYIEKDLREAAIMLQSKYTDNNLGKAGRGSVVGLLMKVLMYQATPGVQSEKWEELVELGDYFVTGKTMTLGDILQFEEKYDEEWETLRKRLWFKPASISAATDPVETPATELGAIANQYGVEYTGIYGDALNYWEIFTQKGEFYRGSVFEVMFRESADGTTNDQNEGTGIIQDLYATRMWTSPTLFDVIKNDPRVSQVIARHGTSTPDGERVDAVENRYVCLKWYTPKRERPLYADDYAKNRRVMRYAEVLLMYAEGLNETGRGADALVQLNKVKNAANKITSSATLYTSGGYGYMRDQIWAERRLELCHEWDRFFDIVRQGRAAKIFRAFASESATTHKRGQYFVEGVNEIFPIPQTEVDLSNGVITQNPGY